jgi:hypothetical protein
MLYISSLVLLLSSLSQKLFIAAFESGTLYRHNKKAKAKAKTKKYEIVAAK